MGKVGSSAISKAVPSSIHIHDLMRINSDDLISPIRAKFYGGLKEYVKRRCRRFFYRAYFAFSKEVKIITLVRDPLERNISMYFQGLPFYISKKYIIDKSVIRGEGKAVLLDAFTDVFNHSYCLDWFDNELYPLTGIDVYREPFDDKAGFNIYRKNNFSVCLVRLDKLSSLTAEISNFLGVNVALLNDNRGEEKWYSPLKKEFDNSFIPSDEYLDFMYGSRLAKHFFSNEELLSFRDRY
jgi:hypothetical protein